jgi:hypothetical protein
VKIILVRKNPFIFKVEWMRSARGGIISFIAVRYRKVARLISLEVLWTSHIQSFSSKCRGGYEFPEVSISRVNMDHPFVRTRVRRSNVGESPTIQRFGSVLVKVCETLKVLKPKTNPNCWLKEPCVNRSWSPEIWHSRGN